LCRLLRFRDGALKARCPATIDRNTFDYDFHVALDLDAWHADRADKEAQARG
jgi:hypothetical protein